MEGDREPVISQVIWSPFIDWRARSSAALRALKLPLAVGWPLRRTRTCKCPSRKRTDAASDPAVGQKWAKQRASAERTLVKVSDCYSTFICGLNEGLSGQN